VEFVLTPEEAQSTAQAIVDYLESEKHKVTIEVSVHDDIPFRPTVSAIKGGMSTYVEAQSVASYTQGVKDLVHRARMEKLYCEIYIAVSMSTSLSGHFLSELSREGVGLMLIDAQGTVSIDRVAANPALQVSPDPTLKLGRLKTRVRDAVKRFNTGERKAALQDMCEIVEVETGKLVKRLAKKSWISASEEEVEKMNWASRIDTAAATKAYTNSRKPIVDDKLKQDLHSFRGARNLIDHSPVNKAAEKKRQTQFVERMHMGPRLAGDLLSLQAKVV
jgi:hypothetical protein